MSIFDTFPSIPSDQGIMDVKATKCGEKKDITSKKDYWNTIRNTLKNMSKPEYAYGSYLVHTPNYY